MYSEDLLRVMDCVSPIKALIILVSAGLGGGG